MSNSHLTLFSGETSFTSAVTVLEWAHRAKPGDRFVYAFGFPLKDARCPGGVLLIETMRAAKKLEKNDKIYMFQKRIDEGIYEYIAIKRSEEFL